MRITLPTAALHAAMSATAPAADGRMLEQRVAHLTARDNTLTIRAGTTLGTTITATVDADVPHDHPATPTIVPHAYLNELADHIRKISSTTTIDLGGATGVHLTAQHADGKHEFTANLRAEPVPDAEPDPDPTPAVTLHATREALTSLLAPEYAVSREAWDTTLGGAYLDGSDGSLTLVGTNGTRLALATQALDQQDASSITGRSITRATAAAIRKALALAGADAVRVTINAAHSHLTIAADAATPRITITVALREATSFPKYQRVIPPANAARTVRVNREALLATIKRLQPLTLAGANALTVTAKDHEIILSVDIEGRHPATERLSVTEGAHEDVSARVNAAYIADALAHYRSAEVDWQLTSPITSVRGVDSVDAGRLDVIAQLRQP
jgi:hypothetical protein